MNEILNYSDNSTANITDYRVYEPVRFDHNTNIYFPILSSTVFGHNLRFHDHFQLSEASLPERLKQHLHSKITPAVRNFRLETLQTVCDELRSDLVIWLADNQPSATNSFIIAPSSQIIILGERLTTCGCF